MRTIGRLLQRIGLFALPLAILMELSGALGRDSGVADMLIMMVFGFVAFSIGRVLEGYAGK
ncbi:MAG: hypothetical protein MK165_07725 [Pirellulaceae bacterium]|nr:hypothetical protein [Pirellulaceae bacterium]